MSKKATDSNGSAQSTTLAAPDAALSMSQRFGVRAAASFVELLGGQPLDRWKMNRQLPPGDRLPFSTLVKMGPKEWYVATWTSAIQRCFFYIPAIYFAGDLWNNTMGKKLEKKYPTLNGLMISAVSAGVVMPCVSWFEGMKADQQLNNLRNMSLWALTKKRYAQYGLRGAIPTPYSSFGREFAFGAGIVWLTPAIAGRLRQNESLGLSPSSTYAVAGAIAGATSQICSQPFDTIKTYQEKFRGVGFIEATKQVYQRGGIAYMWSGALPRVIRGVWTMSCLAVCGQQLTSIILRMRGDSQ